MPFSGPAAEDEPEIAPAKARRALAPLRHKPFLALWIGMLFSNMGIWIQSVGAAWLMTLIASSPDLVAMVQSAASLPVLCFSLLGGVLADMLDRRLVQVLGQIIVMIAAVALSLCDAVGLMTPWLLLAMTFLLGIGSAVRQPAFQASVGDMVPREEIPAAVALNSVNFNIARALGPGIGGLIVAAAGAQMAFLVNAVCNLVTIVMLLAWRGGTAAEPHARESLIGALTAGIRQVAGLSALRRVMVRVTVFCLFASALWALLPLVAKHDLGGGPFTYGLLLGCLGAGAIIAAVLLPMLRRRYATEPIVDVGTALFALATLALAFVHVLSLLIPLLVIGGTAWMTVMSTFNITVQLAAPGWVKARVLAIYYMAMFGSLAAGSWLFGWVADLRSVPDSLSLSGLLLILGIALRGRFRMAETEPTPT